MEVLLRESGMQECDRAEAILIRLTNLDLSNNQIADIKPLAKLKNSTVLDIEGNPIYDPFVPYNPKRFVGFD